MVFGKCNNSLDKHLGKHENLIIILNVKQLKQAIVLEWCALSQRFTDGSVNQWRRHLQAVLQENGGHIEQKFN